MWVVLAFGSAFFAGITSILAKIGIKKTDSTLATAIRTIVVLLMSFIMVLIVGSLNSIVDISTKSWIFLTLSGLATGASWLCYFKALQLGNVNQVVPIDKSSTIMSILLAFVILQEPINWLKGVCIVVIAVGTFLMIEKKEVDPNKKTNKLWILFAFLSAIFAALTSILGKIGIEGVESNLGTFLRTAVVLVMSWLMVLVTKKGSGLKNIDKKELLFICLSGLATGASWLCYYKALQDGLASVVVPIDKLSILITVAFSFFVLKEKLSLKALIGLILIVAGTLCMLIPLP